MRPVFSDFGEAAFPVRLQKWRQNPAFAPLFNRRAFRLNFCDQQLGFFVRNSAHASHRLPRRLARHELFVF